MTTPHNLFEQGIYFASRAVELLSESDDNKLEAGMSLILLSMSIELIAKARLQQEHWSLVVDQLKNFRHEDWITGDFKSVSYEESLDRLEKLLGTKIAHRTAWKTLRKYRNRIEHLGQVPSNDEVKSCTAEALRALFAFIDLYLKTASMSPSDLARLAVLKSQSAKFQEFVAIQMTRIYEEIDTGIQLLMGCISCGLPTALISEGLRCLFCDFRLTDPIVCALAYARTADVIIDCKHCANTNCLVSGVFLDVCFNCAFSVEKVENCCHTCGASALDENKQCGLCGAFPIFAAPGGGH